jgi:hypothetical protein
MTISPSGEYLGGCLCGAVRYTATAAPSATSLCHCRSCRLASGAPSVAWVVFAVQDVAFEGERTAYASSPGVTRTFCGRCGTSLTWQRDDRADTIDLQTATLDDPDAFPPAKEIWVGEKIAWEALNHEAVQYPESSLANPTGPAS